MKTDIYIVVVVPEIKSNSLQQFHAMRTEKQVDTDQGSKLTRFRAYLPLVVGLIFKLIDFVYDKFMN
ncbi:hypothetical protein [Methylomonas albis]|uniref:Uncharacterized protein n=1 Tax=Methylomonas albis TaxID=1854563 RepID=A0ABR9CZX2_9GAMM|nr:hypothetical protein [Methylomonas albis]MBD9356398.1 hypothetical protein [Methylomonas albis]